MLLTLFAHHGSQHFSLHLSWYEHDCMKLSGTYIPCSYYQAPTTANITISLSLIISGHNITSHERVMPEATDLNLVTQVQSIDDKLMFKDK